MRAALVAAVLGLAVLGARPAPAAPVTGAFNGLLLELQTRRENDFGGTLDAARKKKQKAVLKCLALILDRPAAAFIDDMKTYAAVTKLLEAAYPAEMTPGSGSNLRLTAKAVTDDIDLNMAFNESVGGLEQQIFRLAPTPALAKATKLLTAAQGAAGLPSPADSLALWAKNRLLAWKSAEKGQKVAAAAKHLPQPSMDFTADGVAYSADGVSTFTDVTWVYHSVTGRVDISGTYLSSFSIDRRVVLATGLVVQGTPSITIDGGQFEEHIGYFGGEIFPSTGGTITIGTLDVAKHTFTGSFDMTVSGSKAFHVTGTFTATWHLVVVAD